MNSSESSDPQTLTELIKLVEKQQTQIDLLTQTIQNQSQDISDLKVKKLYQMDFTPGSVKNRALGEPNSYIYSGLEANLPTTGVKLTTTGLGCSIYWCTDSKKLKIWNGTAWFSVTLS